MNGVDENILSRYLDGALDYQSACEAAELIASDRKNRDTLIEMLKNQSLLKAVAYETASEEVPARLLMKLNKRKRSRPQLTAARRSFMQIAAAVVLVIIGFATGRIGESDTDAISPFPVIPAVLEKTVTDVLENEKSGIDRTWSDRKRKFTARVTPIRTYRDTNGNFLRYYHVDMNRAGTIHQLAAIALRRENGQWYTQSVFSRDQWQNI